MYAFFPPKMIFLFKFKVAAILAAILVDSQQRCNP